MLRPPPAWLCWPPVPTRNAGNTNPARYDATGIIECMSPDGANCYWSGTAVCQSNIANAGTLAKSSVKCTRELQNTPGTWCNDAARALGMPPSEPCCTRVGLPCGYASFQQHVACSTASAPNQPRNCLRRPSLAASFSTTAARLKWAASNAPF